jgi:hypothetical protein
MATRLAKVSSATRIFGAVVVIVGELGPPIRLRARIITSGGGGTLNGFAFFARRRQAAPPRRMDG